jgi:RNA recognition motif-containing protein
MRIYVGNMNYDTTEEELQEAFEAYGQVDSVSIITDRNTGRAKGFGFVEMSNDEEAKAAMEGLNGQEFMGRTLNVNEARPRSENSRGRGPRRRF